jgi:2-oxoglutarate dehydrogenase E1 component
MLVSKLLRVRNKSVYTMSTSSRGLMTVLKKNQLNKMSNVNAKIAKMASTKRGFCALYYEKLYKQYLNDPKSVEEAWRLYFEQKESGTGTSGQAAIGHLDIDSLAEQIARKIGGSSAESSSNQNASEISGVINLVRAYQTVGHEKAKTDPLELYETYGNIDQNGRRQRQNIDRLDYRFHGFTDVDLDKEYYIDSSYQRGLLSMKKVWKLRDLIDSLEKAYCGSIGVDFMHMQNIEECNWMREKFEESINEQPSKEHLLQSYDRICWSVILGDFLQSKYNTQKRFGLEGIDSFIPGIKCTIDELVRLGTEQVTIGMPHRGRLNVLANVMRKPLDKIFQEFVGEEKRTEDTGNRSGDVKYHLGTSYKRTYDDTGKTLHINLLPNPSHLECINPVVSGYVRAEQHFSKDETRVKNVGILMHGDAAFAGQGLVYETIQMADLYNYTIGGTIHFILNNQIGFTTTPLDARSGTYCTDLAKTIQAPILHVNADDVLAVEKCCLIAAQYRQEFKKDIVVDIIGYRKFGHNELDQPSFTQPLMYERITNRPSVLDIYEKELVEKGVITKEEAKTEYRDRIWAFMNDKYNIARKLESEKAEWVVSEWDTIKIPENKTEFRNTGLPLKKLQFIGKQICTIPEEFDAHRMIRKIYGARLKSITDGVGIDWGTAEALAFATLIDEDFHVRISGQDVERGTFSHRHAIIHSQTADETYSPVERFSAGRIRKFIASNSHLSEAAVLGFEYGYSIVNPNNLTIWESQFGDFYNGAQVIVDQFISAGESKWDISSGLVMLLPHGYDGAGPEHSSSRMERFLEMCDDDPDEIHEFAKDYFNENMKNHNWQIINSSTASNYFHALRRQMHREYRKPLIVVAPKKLLKHKNACSSIEEFGPGLKFQRTIDERNTELISDPSKVKKIIFCTGQIYYDLVKERDTKEMTDTAIITIEQIFPLPYDHLKKHYETYPNATKTVWCQEEPKNYGAYSFLLPRFHSLFKKLGIDKKMTLQYSGRNPNSSPATGFSKVHARQHETLVAKAFSC